MKKLSIAFALILSLLGLNPLTFAADDSGRLLVVMYCGGTWGQSAPCPVTINSISGCDVRGHQGGIFIQSGQMPYFADNNAAFASDCDAKVSLSGELFQGGQCQLNISRSGSASNCSINTSKYPNGRVILNVDKKFHDEDGTKLVSVTYDFEKQ